MKRAMIILLAILLALTLCGCSSAADVSGTDEIDEKEVSEKPEKPEKSEDASADAGDSAEATPVHLGRVATGEITLPIGTLPEFTRVPDGKLLFSTDRYDFEIPATDVVFASLVFGEERSLSLDSIPEYPCEIPDAITEELLAGMTEVEPTWDGWVAEYVSADGTMEVKMMDPKEDDARYICSFYDSNGDELLHASYLIETGELLYVEISEIMDDFGGEESYSVSHYISFGYENGEMYGIRETADGYVFVIDEYGMQYKLDVSYTVDGEVMTLSNSSYYCVFDEETDGEEITSGLLYLSFDDAGNLSGVSFWCESVMYTYDTFDGNWYDPDNKLVVLE